MADRKTFQYYIFSKDKKPLYQDSTTGFILEGDPATLLKVDGSPAHLDESPDDYQKFIIHLARNVKYWGIFRDMTQPTKFIKDGAAILRNRMWVKGFEETCYLGLARLDKTSLPYTYEPWYLSELNMPKIQDNKGFVQIEALEGGISKYFKANEGTQFTIPIDTDPEMQTVLLDGFYFDCKLKYDTFVDFDGSGSHLVPMVFEVGEGTRINVTQNENAIVAVPAPSGYQAISIDWMMTADADTDLHFSGQLRLVPFATPGTYTLKLRTNTNRVATIFTRNLNTPAITIEFEADFQIKNGERLFLEAQWTGATAIVYGESSFNVTFKNRPKPSYARGLYPSTLLKRIVEQLTNKTCTVKSTWLDSKRDILFLSGDSIRTIPGASITISIDDFFNAMGFWQAGLGFEGDTLVIEPLSYFFRDEVILDLGEVAGAKITAAEDIICNTMAAGYDKQDYDDVNGKFEFNQGQQWILPVTKVTRKLELMVTPVRADPFGIEFIRINKLYQDTTDDKGDNTPFMVNIEPSIQMDGSIMYHKLYRPLYSKCIGVPDPVNIFNTELSPKHGILNNGQLIRSLLDFYLDGQLITLASADKNTDLDTILNGVEVLENQQIQAGSLGQQLFRPYYFTFTTQVPINLMKIVNTNPYGKVKFTWNGLDWYGYLCDGSFNPATDETQSWKLIVCPGNDLTKFNA
jgi:hypothetical protein